MIKPYYWYSRNPPLRHAVVPVVPFKTTSLNHPLPPLLPPPLLSQTHLSVVLLVLPVHPVTQIPLSLLLFVATMKERAVRSLCPVVSL